MKRKSVQSMPGPEELHWEDAQLLHRLYELTPPEAVSDAHLRSCCECSSRWEALQLARASSLSETALELTTESRLAEQRRRLWARIDHPRKFWLSKWAPAAATAMMLVTGFVLLHPARPLPSPVLEDTSKIAVSISDAELFSDLTAMASPAAPQAAEPIQALFENSSSKEEGSF